MRHVPKILLLLVALAVSAFLLWAMASVSPAEGTVWPVTGDTGWVGAGDSLYKQIVNSKRRWLRINIAPRNPTDSIYYV